MRFVVLFRIVSSSISLVYNKADRTNLAHERGVKADFVDAIQDLARGFWHV
jgi:hypothetical protein